MPRSTVPAHVPPTPTRAAPAPVPGSVPAHDQPAPPNGKSARKKKKKGKRGPGEGELDDAEPDVGSRALSPELDSVHVSANASLNASAVAAQAELLATANDLYGTIEDGGGGAGEAVWAGLPPELRAYVRAEYAKSVRPTPPSIQNIVNHMERHNWANRQSPPGTATATTQPPFPFDAQLFSDPHFALALEQLTSAGAPKPLNPPAFDEAHID
ncbi:hypothetical protein FRC09_017121, partial [Ceratobasidium sp. 395]